MDPDKEQKLDEHRTYSQHLNECDVPVSGCLAGGTRNKKLDSEEELLDRREKWAPMRRKRPFIGHQCDSKDQPFCASLSKWEAERFGPQYIALQKCNPKVNGGYTVDAVATCAVLVIGAGGLGSPLLMYLAAGGIGIIGIIDGDVVEASNLHRQIVHDEQNEGVNKAVSAKMRMTKINSRGTYIVYDRFFREEEADLVLPKYDIIVDATDNPQTRYLINDACVKHNKILIIASSIGMQGQLMVFNRTLAEEKGPCYKCISPLEGNPFINVRRGACSFSGVLGTLPGVLGCLQATEVLKIAAGAMDTTLAPGVMLLYDATNTSKPFRSVKLKRNVNCSTCGDDVQVGTLKMLPWIGCQPNQVVDNLAISSEMFWDLYMKKINYDIPLMARLSVSEGLLHSNDSGDEHAVYLVDVRPKEHYSLCHVSGATSWPLAEILEDVAELQNPQERTEDSLEDLQEMIIKRVLSRHVEGKVLLLFICFLGNSSRVATDAIRKAIEKFGSTDDVDRFKLFSVAGGCRAIRTRLGIEMPLS